MWPSPTAALSCPLSPRSFFNWMAMVFTWENSVLVLWLRGIWKMSVLTSIVSVVYELQLPWCCCEMLLRAEGRKTCGGVGVVLTNQSSTRTRFTDMIHEVFLNLSRSEVKIFGWSKPRPVLGGRSTASDHLRDLWWSTAIIIAINSDHRSSVWGDDENHNMTMIDPKISLKLSQKKLGFIERWCINPEWNPESNIFTTLRQQRRRQQQPCFNRDLYQARLASFLF